MGACLAVGEAFNSIKSNPFDSIHCGLRAAAVRSTFRFQKLAENFLGAEVMAFDAFQFLIRLNARGNRQEAVETARIKGPVFVLCAAIHKASVGHARFSQAGHATFEDASLESECVS